MGYLMEKIHSNKGNYNLKTRTVYKIGFIKCDKDSPTFYEIVTGDTWLEYELIYAITFNSHYEIIKEGFTLDCKDVTYGYLIGKFGKNKIDNILNELINEIN